MKFAAPFRELLFRIIAKKKRHITRYVNMSARKGGKGAMPDGGTEII